VSHLPGNSTALHWTHNGKKIAASTVIDGYAFNSTFRRRHRMIKHFEKRSALGHTTILNNEGLNVTRLRISGAQEAHKGVYRCQYDKIEAEFVLEFERGEYREFSEYKDVASFFFYQNSFWIC
jgi:hypothetical protein